MIFPHQCDDDSRINSNLHLQIVDEQWLNQLNNNTLI